MIVATWNIQKNGIASPPSKQTVVSHFVDECLKTNGGVGILFLCEVHKSRLADYTSFVSAVYGNYTIYVIPGDTSNYYLLFIRKDIDKKTYWEPLPKGNPPKFSRQLVKLDLGIINLGFGHFKSGATPLTLKQIRVSTSKLCVSNKTWALMGDLNWPFERRDELLVQANGSPNVPKDSCFTAPFCNFLLKNSTQKSGNILDWCIRSPTALVSGYGNDIFAKRFPEIYDMQTGPDHRPVMYSITGFNYTSTTQSS